ncbi:hypothetical protein BSL78_24397 [Apostichopus japonicus]|uniref:Nanos-type domain-containing protein n=1 Tax=Stichopus japonicus TaxID=307972 RepID=A0A2G8JSV3_STIJA|nr:hypothetical protein BSL78_24397 [Apostichopus japonicus]
MEFNPLKDYLGLNALVSRFVVRDSQPFTATIDLQRRCSPCETEGPVGSDMDGPQNSSHQLQPFEIMKLSRVYGDKNNRRKPRKPLSHCVFCKNNAESERVFSSHTLKDENHNITCPILRAYTCPICGANGDSAHTIKYCPLNRGSSF